MFDVVVGGGGGRVGVVGVVGGVVVMVVCCFRCAPLCTTCYGPESVANFFFVVAFC